MGQRAGAVHHQAQVQRSTRRGHWLFACDPQAWGKGIYFIKYIKKTHKIPHLLHSSWKDTCDRWQNLVAVKAAGWQICTSLVGGCRCPWVQRAL